MSKIAWILLTISVTSTFGEAVSDSPAVQLNSSFGETKSSSVDPTTLTASAVDILGELKNSAQIDTAKENAQGTSGSVEDGQDKTILTINDVAAFQAGVGELTKAVLQQQKDQLEQVLDAALTRRAASAQTSGATKEAGFFTSVFDIDVRGFFINFFRGLLMLCLAIGAVLLVVVATTCVCGLCGALCGWVGSTCCTEKPEKPTKVGDWAVIKA